MTFLSLTVTLSKLNSNQTATNKIMGSNATLDVLRAIVVNKAITLHYVIYFALVNFELSLEPGKSVIVNDNRELFPWKALVVRNNSGKISILYKFSIWKVRVYRWRWSYLWGRHHHHQKTCNQCCPWAPICLQLALGWPCCAFSRSKFFHIQHYWVTFL